jgi:hypothetical protein
MGLFNNYLSSLGSGQQGSLPPYGAMPQQTATSPYWPSSHKHSGGCPGNSEYTDDYILKTQIVPPVCPSCPSCGTGSGVCTNCGGNGGSGTKTTNGKTMVSGEEKQTMYDKLTDEHSFFGEGTPTTGKKDANGNDVQWKSDISKGTFSSNADPNTLAGGLVLSQYSLVAGLEEGAYTAADVAKSGLGTIGGAIKDVTGTVGGVANNAITGVTGLAKNNQGSSGMAAAAAATGPSVAASSAGTAGGPSPTMSGRAGPGSNGPVGTRGPGSGSGGVSYTGPQSIDQYSYYGTLPAKAAGNYMPVTADFSTFRK